MANTDVTQTDGWVKGFSPFAPSLQQDPFPTFARFRQECPVARSEALGGFWVLSRYDDVRFALQHHELFSNAANVVPPSHMTTLGPDIPTQLDPPEHTVYRTILNPSFSPRVVNALEDEIRTAARRLLEPIAARGHCDFMAEFAVPFPTEVFCRFMGLPAEELATFLRWKDVILRAEPGQQAAQGQAVRDELAGYFATVYRDRTNAGDPGNDLMGALIASNPDGVTPLSQEEFVRTACFLWAAGLDTVTAQLGFALLYLGRHPEQRDRLVAEPAIIPSALEELIRYDTLVNDCRLVLQDVELNGQTLRAGDIVLLLYASAGRDPEQFPAADEVDLERQPNRHLGFGAGVHRCAGSHLARMQMRIALEEIHRMIPSYAVDESTPPQCHLGWIRGVDVLHLTIDTPPRATTDD